MYVCMYLLIDLFLLIVWTIHPSIHSFIHSLSRYLFDFVLFYLDCSDICLILSGLQKHLFRLILFGLDNPGEMSIDQPN